VGKDHGGPQVTRAGAAALPVLLADDNHVARGALDEPLRHRAEQRARHEITSLSADHDQVGADLLRHRCESVCDVALRLAKIDLCVVRKVTTRGVEEDSGLISWRRRRR